jgi:CheY-like chemotaxis protein
MFVDKGHVRGCPTGGALTSLVGVVDDDESGRAALSSLIRSAGYMCAVFPSAEAFLAAGGFAGPHCMVLDVHMPGLSGLELQVRLRQMKCPFLSFSLPPIGTTKRVRPHCAEVRSRFSTNRSKKGVAGSYPLGAGLGSSG